MSAVSANKLELIQIADAVAREKSIDKTLVIEALEEALSRAARSRYGQETNIRAEINPTTGETRLWRLLEAVEIIENDAAEILLEDARHKNPEAEIGDYISEPLPPIQRCHYISFSMYDVLRRQMYSKKPLKMYSRKPS